LNDTPADVATQLADGTASHASKPRAVRLPMAFQRVLLAALISGLGDGLRLTALPLLAVRISDKVAVVAAVTVAGTVPWLLFGLFVGALADRADRRRMMWVTDMARAVLAAGFVALLFSGVRDIAVLVIFAFLMGFAQTFFDTASGAFLPAVVPASQLTVANGRLMSVQMLAAQLIGPVLAGFLTVVALELPFAVDAVSFLAAAALVLTVRPTHRGTAAQSGSASLGADIVAGLRWLNGRPALRAQSGLFVVLSAVSGAVLAVFVAYARHTLDVGSIGYGVLISIFAAGGVLGGSVASPACIACSGSAPYRSAHWRPA
jgi:MFS family permease